MVIGGAYSIGQSDSSAAYSSITEFESPDWFQLKVSDDTVKLIPGVDFNYYRDRAVIQFTEPLESYGFSKTLANINGQLKMCFELWAVYQEYNSLRDGFTGIMDLPVEWLWKYPGAVQAAWSIKQNGANKRDVIRLLGCIGLCPYSTDSGRIHIVDSSTVQIGSKIYKGAGTCLVHQNALVEADTKLFSGPDTVTDISAYPAVYSYKDSFPAISNLHVITDVGVLMAPNSSTAITNNILPLKELDGTTSTTYSSLCTSRNMDQKIPYATIPSPVNPAQFIFKQVWGASASLIIAPPANTKDMQIAVDFIVRNTTLGAVVTAYQYNTSTPGSPDLLYPDKAVQEQLLIYYRTSINNGTTYKERLKDFEQ